MSISREAKSEIIANYKRKEDDTGSPEVQCAILTSRITSLSGHFKSHPKDRHSRRGLIMMVNKRRRLLQYLKVKDPEAYENLIKRLQLRK